MAYKNGQLPASVLVKTSDGEFLNKSAAASYERLNHEFVRKFGKRLGITSGYRPISKQVALYKSMGYPAAAIPGTSNHGLGVACDFGSGVSIYGSPEHKWMDTVGRRHGWIPLWESLGKSRNLFEPWHWVHVPSKDRYPWRRVKYTGVLDRATIYSIQRATGRAVTGATTPAGRQNLWKAIQREINKHQVAHVKGYVPLKVDGDPGPKTVMALQAFLRRVLKFWRPQVDGDLGPRTIRAFQRALNAKRF
jgi:hypothetical protein